MAENSLVKSIDRVVESAREKYDSIMLSNYVARDIKIDGVLTRGQQEEQKKRTTTEDEYTRTITCMLGSNPRRGSLIEIKNPDDDTWEKGIITSIPQKTPVDYLFYVLIFNTEVKRYRKKLIYSEDGYVIGNNPLIEDSIPCFVQRIGMRERQVDVGIDSDSVNEFITLKDWDIEKGDILHVGSERYKVTDLRELDKEICQVYMTYYRE